VIGWRTKRPVGTPCFSIVARSASITDPRLHSFTNAAILGSRDRSRAGQLAPSHGLTLERVVYGHR